MSRAAGGRPEGWSVISAVMRGKVSNWWNGGGEDKVHSSVVAPGPQGLSPATRFTWKAS